jgi:hypothetical protein
VVVLAERLDGEAGVLMLEGLGLLGESVDGVGFGVRGVGCGWVVGKSKTVLEF